jgi:hypothetical protein
MKNKIVGAWALVIAGIIATAIGQTILEKEKTK